MTTQPTFSPGDRVEFDEFEGRTGTVRGTSSTGHYAVELDDPTGCSSYLHSCDGLVPSRRGWYFYAEELRRLAPEQPYRDRSVVFDFAAIAKRANFNW